MVCSWNPATAKMPYMRRLSSHSTATLLTTGFCRHSPCALLDLSFEPMQLPLVICQAIRSRQVGVAAAAGTDGDSIAKEYDMPEVDPAEQHVFESPVDYL